MSDQVVIALIVAVVPVMGALGKAIQWLADRQQSRKQLRVTKDESKEALAAKDDLILTLRGTIADKNALIAELRAQLAAREGTS